MSVNRYRGLWVLVLTLSFVVLHTPRVLGQSCLRGFAGEWKTQHGNMTLNVRGDQASATYGANRTVTGTIRGNVFTGRWRHANGRWGRVEFSHDGNGNFAGRYGEKDGPLRSTWWGKCSASLPPPVSSGPSSGTGVGVGAGTGPTGGTGGGVGVGPAGGVAAGCTSGFAGQWQTQHGKMTISVRGDQLSGSYGSGRTVSGTIVGNVFTGTWRYPSGRWGGVRFTHDGNGGFSGAWAEKDGALGSGWSGKCTTPGGGPGGVSGIGPGTGGGGFSGMCAAVSGTGGAGICQNPRTEQLMNDWLARAIPRQKPGASLRYDCWGRAIGRATSGVITANQRPDTDGRVRCDYLRDHGHLY
jgi:hypothetical protein